MTPFAEETAAARAAHSPWANVPVRDRLRHVREFRHLLVDRRDALTAAMDADVQRPPDELIATDLLPTAAAAKYLERHAARLLKPKRIGGAPLWLMGCGDTVHRRPWGVVGVIGTWNYPLLLNAVPVLHALAAGNAVLWKPSERTPRFAAVFADLVRDAGFPAGVFTPLPGDRDAGPRLAEADVDFLHFTGSEAVGRALAARLGERLVPSALELSGCDAVFVLADADVELAARTAWYAATFNRGRTCMAIRRAFVARAVYEGFAAAVVKLNPSPPLTKGGQLILPPPLSKGGPGGVAAGEPTPPGPPLERGGEEFQLLLDPPPDHPACREASFDPRLAVMPFDTLDDAVRMHAACAFRLTAAVFTRDPAEADRLAARLPVGCVTVNDAVAPTAHPATPFGGRGASGWGVTQGAEGLLQMTAPQVVTHRGGTFRPHVDAALNADPAAADVTGGMLAFTHGRTLRDRWRGFVRMVAGMRRFGKR